MAKTTDELKELRLELRHLQRDNQAYATLIHELANNVQDVVIRLDQAKAELIEAFQKINQKLAERVALERRLAYGIARSEKEHEKENGFLPALGGK